MYHPELYPELAKNNYKGGELINLTDLKYLEKVKLSMERKEKKNLKKEFHIVSKYVPTKNLDDLKGNILKRSIRSHSLSSEHYTSRYEIEPIIEEMKSVAKQFFVPNLESYKNHLLDRVSRESLANQRQEILPRETTSLENLIYTEDFVDRDSFNTTNYDYLVQLYKNEVESNNPVDLQEMLIDMKEQGFINSHTNIQIDSNYTKIKNQENIYLDENIAMKIEYEELLKKMKDFTDEELSNMLSHYDLNTREELQNEIEEEINILNQEIMIKYLQIQDPDYQLESENEMNNK